MKAGTSGWHRARQAVHREHLLAAPRDCTLVWAPNGAVLVHEHCVADMFTAGELTVSAAGQRVRTYVAGTWREAVSYGADGHPLFGFHADRQGGC
jgi:hypothetical protein